MNNRTDLVGKTISGIIAAPGTADGPVSIWMLQFTDGTHVEFVSPSARRALDRFSGARRGRAKARRTRRCRATCNWRSMWPEPGLIIAVRWPVCYPHFLWITLWESLPAPEG